MVGEHQGVEGLSKREKGKDVDKGVVIVGKRWMGGCGRGYKRGKWSEKIQ